MKASEALALSATKVNTEKLKEIFRLVKEAATEGKLEIMLPEALQPLEVKGLESFGYDVRTVTQDYSGTGNTTTISWANA